MNHRCYGAVFVLTLLAASAAVAQEAPMERFPDPIPTRFLVEPLRLAETRSLPALDELAPAAQFEPEKIDEMLAWNAAGKYPIRIGYERSLSRVVSVHLANGDSSPGKTAPVSGEVRAIVGSGNLRWGARLLVRGAKEVRVFLDDVAVPPGTTFWVWAIGQEPRAFDISLQSPDGWILSPTAEGEEVFLEIDLPDSWPTARSAYGFRLARVVEVPRLESEKTGRTAPGDCLIDATCVGPSTFPAIDIARAAIGQLSYWKNGNQYVCTGGLLNDTDTTTFIPYLLTANHCFTTQAEASTLEIAWDYKTSTCGGAFPTIVRTNPGATLLATSAVSDFTFLRLASVPGGRAALGWNASASAAPAGTVLHRVSHPAPNGTPYSQGYSQSQVSNTVPTCSGDARPLFLYATMLAGGTYGGSSGSPVVLATGQVIGQLKGGCLGQDGCNYADYEKDGAFSATYPSIAQWLDPPPSQTLTVTKAGSGSGTVTSSPAGINCGGTCSSPFASGTVVTLSAAATAGSIFAGWSGEGCSGTGTCVVTMTQARNVTPTFSLTGGGGGCTPGTTTLCIDGAVNGDKRFKIEVDWSTIQSGGQSGKGTAVATAPIGFVKGGIFWFFDSTNPEMLVKVINGCGVNGKFWVFASAGTNVGLNVKVTDTQTGLLNSYVNPDLTAAQPVQDIVAFSCN